MYVVDLRSAAYYQKCHDPDCRGAWISRNSLSLSLWKILICSHCLIERTILQVIDLLCVPSQLMPFLVHGFPRIQDRYQMTWCQPMIALTINFQASMKIVFCFSVIRTLQIAASRIPGGLKWWEWQTMLKTNGTWLIPEDTIYFTYLCTFLCIGSTWSISLPCGRILQIRAYHLKDTSSLLLLILI